MFGFTARKFSLLMVIIGAYSFVCSVGYSEDSSQKIKDKSKAEMFDKFCEDNFGAEKDDLVYKMFGDKLKFMENGFWLHQSTASACIGLETNLPAKVYIEYGRDNKYGNKTEKYKRFHYLHIHYLKGLEPKKTYHYRIVAVDERGNELKSEDKTFKTIAKDKVIRIPEDMQGPPYVLNKSGAHYVVTKDLVVDGGRAFDIPQSAQNVTLDLGGHTVIYNAKKNVPQLALKGVGFPTYHEKAAFGVFIKKSTVKIVNGTLKQGYGDGAQANSIGFNPLYFYGGGGEVAGITAEYCGPQVTGIYTHWGNKLEIHHNVIRDMGTVVTDRHQGMQAIGPGNTPSAHHNLIWRTRQRGIKVAHAYNNEIYIDSYSTNAFGVWLQEKGKYHDNRVFGTGYHAVAFGWGNGVTIKDNLIYMAGSKPDGRFKEYGNICSVNGMRLTQYFGSKRKYENCIYEGNTIIMVAREGCRTRGVEFFTDPYVKNLVFRNNIVKSTVADNSKIQSGCIVAQGNWKFGDKVEPILYQDNTFISNAVHIRFGDDYGTGDNHRFSRCKFVRIGDRKDYKTFVWGSGYRCKNQYIRDCTFENGAGLDSINFAAGDHELIVQWTLSVETLSGANVSVIDKDGKEIFTGNTDKEGKVEIPLSEYRHNAGGKVYYGDYSITVKKDGKSATRKIKIDKPTTINIKL